MQEQITAAINAAVTQADLLEAFGMNDRADNAGRITKEEYWANVAAIKVKANKK